MPWIKVIYRHPQDCDVDVLLLALAERRDKELGNPSGFAVFDRRLPDSDGEVFEYYFSPVAASACAGMLASFLPELCDKPDPEGLRIAYGDLLGTTSWDLLK